MAKMGRPKIVIDWEYVKKLAAIQCTVEEVSTVLSVSVDTLDSRCKKENGCTCSEYLKKNSGFGKMSLRRWQYNAAERGNVTMLIWLGKQYLGQKDKIETEVNSADNWAALSDILKGGE